MELHIRTDATIAMQLEREIKGLGITQFYLLPFENDQVDFLFLALSDHEKKLLSYTLKKYSYTLIYLA